MYDFPVAKFYSGEGMLGPVKELKAGTGREKWTKSSFKPALCTTTAEKIQTTWCAGGKRGEWLFFYLLPSIFCQIVMRILCFLKKCKTVNGSNYYDFQRRVLPKISSMNFYTFHCFYPRTVKNETAPVLLNEVTFFLR